MDAVLDFCIRLLTEMWALCRSMAFWLIVGFLLAGVLTQMIPQSFIRRHLAPRGWKSIIKAVLIGCPLPICSCGVIPVAAGLRKAGASRGSVAAFTVTTPQTGVDSIAVTYSLMGLPFMLGRILSDLLSGLLAGGLINATETKKDREADAAQLAPECPKCRAAAEAAEKAKLGGFGKRVLASLKEAFFGLPADIGKYVLFGIFLGALLATVFPKDALADYLSNPWLAYLLVSVVAIPMYVCSTGAIPIAFGLIASGFSPGAAIVFLSLGPATNAATITVLWKMLGRKATLIYLGSLAVAAWSMGFLFDRFGLTVNQEHATHAAHGEAAGWDTFFAIAMLAMFAIAFVFKNRRGDSGDDASAKACH